MSKNLQTIYQKTRVNTSTGKGIEITVLEMASARMRLCLGKWSDESFDRSLDTALRFNQKLWDVLQSDWSSAQNPLPTALKNDLLSLSLFVRKSTFALMIEPDRQRLEALIQINENLISGLRNRPVDA